LSKSTSKMASQLSSVKQCSGFALQEKADL
jgi:hypothetical protein